MEKLEQRDKYYTPDIKEFRVGFEYEYAILNNGEIKWIKDSFGKIVRSMIELEFLEKDKNIRVKYLDKQDIEELGWTAIGKIDDDGSYIIPYFSKLNKYRLYPYGKNRIMIVRPKLDIPKGMKVGIIKDCEIEESMFDGTIKNKSELEVLMKQLGI